MQVLLKGNILFSQECFTNYILRILQNTWKKLYLLMFPLFPPHTYVGKSAWKTGLSTWRACYFSYNFVCIAMHVDFFPFLEKDYHVHTIRKKLCWWWSFSKAPGDSSVMDQKPKFYGRNQRFKTYGYGGPSLRPILLPKVLFVVFLVFFSKMETEMQAFLCFHLSLD